MNALSEMQITRDPTEAEWAITFHFSLESQVSVYDAVYLSLALNRDVKMVTSDRSFFTKLR